MKTRFQNWPSLLAASFESARNAPFAWGVNDCCLFAAGVIQAITGRDLAEKFRGQYDSALSAWRLLEPLGGVEGMAETICGEQGFVERSVVALAMRGDLVLIDTPAGPTLGICEGARAAFAGENGLEFLPLNKCRRAWGI